MRQTRIEFSKTLPPSACTDSGAFTHASGCVANVTRETVPHFVR